MDGMPIKANNPKIVPMMPQTSPAMAMPRIVLESGYNAPFFSVSDKTRMPKTMAAIPASSDKKPKQHKTTEQMPQISEVIAKPLVLE